MKFILVLIFTLSGCFTVRNQQEKIVEKFGKFNRIAKPGLNFKWPFIERDYEISLKVQELNIKSNIKTKDDVFVFFTVNIQIFVTDTYKAFYSLTNYNQQISSFINSTIKNEFSKLELKEVFAKKQNILKKIKIQTSKEIANFGYGINKIMIDIDLNQKIKKIMNQAKLNQLQEVKSIENIPQIKTEQIIDNNPKENKKKIQERVLKIRRYGRSFTCYEDS